MFHLCKLSGREGGAEPLTPPPQPLPKPTYNSLRAYKAHTLEIGTKRKKEASGRLRGRRGDCPEGREGEEGVKGAGEREVRRGGVGLERMGGEVRGVPNCKCFRNMLA